MRASSITEFGNVPEVLLKYRVWPGSNFQSHRQLAWETHIELLVHFIKDFLNVDPAIEAVAGLRQTRVGPLFRNLSEIRLTAALIQALHEKFVQENDLTFEERREITWDAARRLASLALQASRFDLRAFIRLFIQATKLDHRLLYPAALKRGMERRRLFAMGDKEIVRNRLVEIMQSVSELEKSDASRTT